MYDVVIIGAGIIGSFLARDLSKYNMKILVLDKENDVANETTMANSAIIHSGHDPKEGTLKAKLNLEGSRMYKEICHDLNVSYQQIGAYVLATNEDEYTTIQVLYKQATKRGINCKIEKREEILQKEENISDNVIAGLWLPTTAIVYPWEVAIALMENAMDNGVKLHLNEEVKEISKDLNYEITTNKDVYKAKMVINCAGVYADQVYSLLNQKESFSIKARKGEYFVLDKLEKPLVKSVIYPTPSKNGKGVLIVPTTHGNTLLGPTSYFIDHKEDTGNTSDGLAEVKQKVGKLINNIPYHKIIRTFAGNRPSGSTHDFIIEEAKDYPRFYNVAAIESPGLASAPAISKYVVNLIKETNSLTLKKKFIYCRRANINLKNMSNEQKNQLVEHDPRFAKIICRCEQVTEGEIIDCIHRNCGATTVKGVKKRCRPGMGRCQGGFCEPLVMEILARELKIKFTDVVYDSLNSMLLMERTKGE